ncbi:MAG TPA: hypothetical protein VNA21_14645, partial [Steroidobacteraceae bacterium]|nr:hypothetical protein [Steroidobacteraceae bacterium]
MNSPAANDFDRLASLYGIGASYNDFKGDLQHIATTSKAAILGVMGVEASDQRAIDAAIAQQETVHWMRMLPAVVVATQGRPSTVEVSIPLGLKAKEVTWTATLESGTPRTGSIGLSKLEVLEKGALDKRKFTRARLELPADLPLGYHALNVTLDTGLAGDARLIIAPETSFEPPAIRRGERVWG